MSKYTTGEVAKLCSEEHIVYKHHAHLLTGYVCVGIKFTASDTVYDFVFTLFKKVPNIY